MLPTNTTIYGPQKTSYFMPNKTLTGIIILSAVLTACAVPAAKTSKPVDASNPQPEVPVVSVVPAQPTNNVTSNEESIAEYLNKVLLLTGDGQKKELQDLNAALQSNRQDTTTRTKLALLYGLPSSKVRDLNKAQSLAEDLLKESSITNERKAMMLILRDYIAESIKISQRVREEQKKSDAMQSKLESLQLKSDAAQQKADSLQQKLDELKNIEKTMIERSHSNKK